MQTLHYLLQQQVGEEPDNLQYFIIYHIYVSVLGVKRFVQYQQKNYQVPTAVHLAGRAGSGRVRPG